MTRNEQLTAILLFFATSCLLPIRAGTPTAAKAQRAHESQAEKPAAGYSFVVWTTDGKQIAYAFADEPRLTIEGNEFVMTTERTTMRYAAKDIKKFTLKPVAEGEEPEKYYSFIVWTTDGKQFAYAFADEPRLTIEGSEFVMASQRTTMRYAAKDILKFTLKEGDTSPENQIDAFSLARPQIHLAPDELSVTGCRPHAMTTVYTADGLQVAQHHADADGRLHLSLSTYGQGIYLIKTETTTFKIIKK